MRTATVLSKTERPKRVGTSFEAFFRQHYTAVEAGVRAAGVTPALAADATQEAFVKAYPRWWRLQRFTNPAAWVQRVAINAGRDLDRSERRQGRHLPAVSVESTSVGASDVHTPALGFDDVEPAVAELPTQQQAAIRAYYGDGLSTAETAEQMGVSPGAVRFHLSKARDGLRSVLPNPDETPAPALAGDGQEA